MKYAISSWFHGNHLGTPADLLAGPWQVRVEKVEYKIIALEYTRQVLRELVVTEKRVKTAVEDEIIIKC